MFTVIESSTFKTWFAGLRDGQAKARINARIRRLSMGNFGDAKGLKGASGVSEMRINYGPGYRVFFTQTERVVIVLLCGGDKRTQDRDIALAKKMVADLKE